jgi:hypothetical protein
VVPAHQVHLPATRTTPAVNKQLAQCRTE